MFASLYLAITNSDDLNNSKIVISAEDDLIHQFAANSEMEWFACFGDLSWNCPYLISDPISLA